ncbi:MAG TPA: ring-cleaving dioxygenase [Opitutaceae bacterium]|nr:ring-cleaving dioxygenase [Opitutaceae bacterium]HND60340.1 ring-cleaving dioxygenase [Opitutaceae bacterium]
MNLLGLHHITAMASDPRANFEFYTRVLALRFVKKSVNQDDPGTYHLYYGDYTGSPGTALTFFPWPGLRRGRPGSGQSYATGFSVPQGSLEFWQERLARLGIKTEPVTERFGEKVLTTFDPDGLRLDLIAANEPDPREPAPSNDVPAAHAIRGFHSTTLGVVNPTATIAVLTQAMGYRLVATEGHRARYTVGAGGPGTYVDLLTDPALPRGVNGAGTIHHVAFRTPTDASQVEARSEVARTGLPISPVIDRAYFKSIYYREPSGILFEIATDQPGFTIDEPAETLGSKLGLPPHLEPHRAEIEAALPPLTTAP